MSSVLTPQSVLNDTRLVKTVRVVVHTTGPAGPTISDNHWSIYLLLHAGGSVRLNMAAEAGYVNGTLEWTSHAYLLTNSAVRHWDYPVPGNVRVCDIARFLYANKRHQYDMSGGGSGCRYWVWVIMKDWSNKHWIAQGAANELWADLLYRYHKTNPRIALNMVQGTFYT